MDFAVCPGSSYYDLYYYYYYILLTTTTTTTTTIINYLLKFVFLPIVTVALGSNCCDKAL